MQLSVDSDKIFKDKLQKKERPGMLLKRFGKHKATTKSTSLIDWRMHTMKRTWPLWKNW